MEQPGRHTHDTAPRVIGSGGTGTTGIVLAHHENRFIALHFAREGLVERLAVGDRTWHVRFASPRSQ